MHQQKQNLAINESAPYCLPSSAANYTINLFCVIFFFAIMGSLYYFFPQAKPITLTTASLCLILIPLALYDLLYDRVYKRKSTGLLSEPGKVNKKRLIIKLVGLYATFVIVLSYYFLIYKFFEATYLKIFFEFLIFFSPWIIIACFIYFREIDRRQKDPYDEYWNAGCFFTGRFNKVNKNILNEYARVWFIKGFFIPYVFVILVRYVEALISINWDQWNFMFAYTFLLDLFYTIDILYAVLGYILTCRLLDTHVRSTDQSILGWLVCLVCYGPFYAYFGIGLLPYEDGFQWNHWFIFHPGSYYFIGGTILFLSLIYCLATVAIGYRMSNLTYRGIITSGPYRFTKHPAYLSKVTSWWLISLPFFYTGNQWVAIKHTLALSFITFIYYLRAKTEENHLSNYPEYVEYAKWMNEHGVFSFISRLFPALQYSEEKTKKRGSVVLLNNR